MALPLLPEMEIVWKNPRVVRVLGLNPGRFTLQGTNTYIVGKGEKRILIDCGEGKAAYPALLKRVMDSEGCRNFALVLCTHKHEDHIGGVQQVLDWHRQHGGGGTLDIWKGAPAGELEAEAGFKTIKDGDVFRAGGAVLRALQTPGHTDDHFCFLLHPEHPEPALDQIPGLSPHDASTRPDSSASTGPMGPSGGMPMEQAAPMLGSDLGQINTGLTPAAAGLEPLTRTRAATPAAHLTRVSAALHSSVSSPSSSPHLVFTGDCVLGCGSTVFDDLSTYMASLRRLLTVVTATASSSTASVPVTVASAGNPPGVEAVELGVADESSSAAETAAALEQGTASPTCVLFPGHGPVVEEGLARLNEYIAHREERERQIIDVLVRARKGPSLAVKEAPPESATSAPALADASRVVGSRPQNAGAGGESAGLSADNHARGEAPSGQGDHAQVVESSDGTRAAGSIMGEDGMSSSGDTASASGNAACGDGDGWVSVWQIVSVLYADIPKVMWPAACHSVQLHLDKLEAEGHVKRSRGRLGWRGWVLGTAMYTLC